MPINIQLPDWAQEVFFEPAPLTTWGMKWRESRHKALYGGRSGAKTETIVRALLIRCMMKKTWIMCGREFQNSISASVKSTIDEIISLYGLNELFASTKTEIIYKPNESKFSFHGMNRNIANIKGWNYVDIFWGEEAETFLPETLEILFPTLRKPGSEFVFSWNRKRVASPIDSFYLDPKKVVPRAITRKVNYDENPFHPPEMEEERLRCLNNEPERYPHIWLGEVDEGAGAYKILKYSDLKLCEDAHIKLGWTSSGMRHAGLDVADDGVDTNAYACRRGPLLESVEEWKVKYLWQTANKADLRNRRNGVVKMFYDAGGLGAGIKSELSKVPKNPETGTGPEAKKFIPFLFGGKVKGPDKIYVKAGKDKITNGDFFHRQNAQAAWNLKQRVQRTIMALDGQKVDLDKCFFVSSKIDDLDQLLVQMAQPVYDDGSGKIKLDKDPDGIGSPNKWDAVLMAYASDIKKGLKA